MDSPSNNRSTGSVVVAGGGIAGIQASLDLAKSGFKVYLIESTPAIGGKMAYFDKTFPTNDCAMCILSPKLVECSRHLNIELMTMTDVKDIRGEAGDFTVSVVKRPRYIDLSKCTGCGSCSKYCPVKVPNESDFGLSFRKAIYTPYPQAVPSSYVIDMEKCRLCKACVKKCEAKAVDLEEQPEEMEIKAGSVIFAAGSSHYQAQLKEEFGWGIYPNVIIGPQLERMLSPSGPYKGHIKLPSDGGEPKRIAFLQCIGSRDVQNPYCSSVCCMYATKQAILVKEHIKEAECEIFLMDMRAFSKGFDEYFSRAKNKHGIKYRRCRISSVKNDFTDNKLTLRYQGDSGEINKEIFDMVVLSTGLTFSKENQELMKKTGIKINKYGYPETKEFYPLETSRPGIFGCGSFLEPKDIPESVLQASGASAKAMELLSGSRGTLVKTKEYPEEMKMENEEPRIGVFVCHCGTNIASVVNVEAVVEEVKKLQGVVHAQTLLYTCSEDSQKLIKDTIKEKNLNRLIVAACSPRTHEPLFRETMKESGLNPYLFEMANIREQCSWIHSNEPEKATKKTVELVRMAVARSKQLVPLYESTVSLSQSALIIGGGLAGLTTAVSIGKQGFDVYLIERSDQLGGNLKDIHSSLEEEGVGPFLDSLVEEAMNNDKIKIFLETELIKTTGFVGNFLSLVRNKDGGEQEIGHGVTVVATGAREYRGSSLLESAEGRIITLKDLEEKMRGDKEELGGEKRIVFIQCVGPFEERPFFCSRICCNVALKNALKLKELNPETEVVVLYKDLRTYGFGERYYTEAREKGVVFIRFDEDDPPEIVPESGGVKVNVNDLSLKARVSLEPDLVVLSSAIIPPEGNERLASVLKVPLNQEGFFMEAHVKLRPVDFSAEGIFLCGMAHYPKLMKETIAQALAVSSRAATLLSKKEMKTLGAVADIEGRKCVACLTCIRVCPYKAPFINEEGIAQIEVAKCQGCGICAGACPAKAIQLLNYTDSQIISKCEALMEEAL